MAKLLLVNDRGEEQLFGAKVAEAQLELLRIRSARARMMKAVDLESCDSRSTDTAFGPHKAQAGLLQAVAAGNERRQFLTERTQF